MPQEAAGKGEKRPLRIGKYEVIKHIATGGMGEVYEARDTVLDRVVALKVLSPELAAKPNMVERFKREGRRAAGLRHENIVDIFDCGESNGKHFLAFEFIKGRDLHDHIIRRGRLSVAESRQIMIQALRALDHAFHRDIVHRDIKPANFLLTKSDKGHLQVKLADLGLARLVDDDDHRLTKVDSTIGTIDYMPPEQAQDSSASDIRSDIYSLGCTLYHMLAGKPPFPTGTLVERILKHRDAEPEDIRKFNAKVPLQVVRIMQKMMAKQPDERYQTPQELLSVLENPGNFPEVGDEPEPELRPLEPSPKERAARQVYGLGSVPQRQEVPGTDHSRHRDKTVEVTRPLKSIPEKKKRFRDEDEPERPRNKRRRRQRQERSPLFIGGSAAFLVLAVLCLLTWLLRRQSADDDQGKPDVAPVIVKDRPPGDLRNTPVKPGPGPVKAGAPPLLYRPTTIWKPDALKDEFIGPFMTAPSVPGDARLVRVRRLPGAGEYATVGEAVAMTTGPLLIEIHDQGPIFESAWPALRDRTLWIRAGAGYRPLLAWDPGTAKFSAPLATMTGGDLTLESLDVVTKWPLGHAEGPGCLFALRDTNFEARQCTFTVGGKNARGIALLQLERLERTSKAAVSNEPAAEAAAVRVHLKQCYARGSDLLILDGKGVSLDALMENCLLVSGGQPMFRIANNDEDNLKLRLVRSTLVCSQNLLRWNNLTGKAGSPHVDVRVWDSLLSRSDTNAPQGDLLVMGDGADLVHVKWRPVNALYAGWKRLLVSADKSVNTGAMDFWRAVWSIREGDQELTETWPGTLPSEPEALAAQVFSPVDTPVYFAASGGPGPLGSELSNLPPEPKLALQRTFDRYPAPTVSLPDSDAPPTFPAKDPDLYQGERLNLMQIDLGKHLQTVLQTAKPGPRVVLYLSGKGKQFTSPIKVKGIANLVLYFEPVLANEEPLTLTPNPLATEEREPLLDVEDGNLEIIKGRFLLENKRPSAAPAYLIRLRGGDLVLNRCYLQGALDKAPEAYQGLVRFDGAAGNGALPGVLFNDTVMVSSRSLLDLYGGARVRLRNCAAVSGDHGLLFSPVPAAKIFVNLEHNTLAVHQAMMAVRTQAGDVDNIVVQAQENYFLSPFSGEPRNSRLVGVAAEAVAQGVLLWQGKGNAFDTAHLQAYLAGVDDAPVKQSFKDWTHLWGPNGEHAPTQLEPAKAAKAFTIDPPSWPNLALPPQFQVGTGPPPFGADLIKLGIITKKRK